MMAVNGLLAASGGGILCVHDHTFGHFVTTEHTEHSDDCHDHHHDTTDETHSHGSSSNNADFLNTSSHCFDIVISPSEEPIRHISDLSPAKKPIVLSNYGYEQFEPAKKASAAPEIRLASRAPPIICGVLEQCVRKTVLRI